MKNFLIIILLLFIIVFVVGVSFVTYKLVQSNATNITNAQINTTVNNTIKDSQITYTFDKSNNEILITATKDGESYTKKIVSEYSEYGGKLDKTGVVSIFNYGNFAFISQNINDSIVIIFYQLVDNNLLQVGFANNPTEGNYGYNIVEKNNESVLLETTYENKKYTETLNFSKKDLDVVDLPNICKLVFINREKYSIEESLYTIDVWGLQFQNSESETRLLTSLTGARSSFTVPLLIYLNKD